MSARRVALRLWPVAMFAAALAGLQALSGSTDWRLAAGVLAAAAAAMLLSRLIPWTWLLGRVAPRSRWFPVVLFLWILRHFVAVLGEESRRLLIARRLAVPREYHAGWWRSLRWALTALFRRALVRAERFYAAQAFRGFDA